MGERAKALYTLIVSYTKEKNNDYPIRRFFNRHQCLSILPQ